MNIKRRKLCDDGDWAPPTSTWFSFLNLSVHLIDTKINVMGFGLFQHLPHPIAREIQFF